MKLHFCFFCLLLAGGSVRGESSTNLPPFQEVYSLLRTNLEGVSDSQLDHLATAGLLDKLSDRVSLVLPDGGEVSNSTSPPLASTSVLGGAFAYVRVARVESNLCAAFTNSFAHLSQTNKSPIKGIVLDLRFAGGDDYAAAGALADQFTTGDRVLLDWGSSSVRSSGKDKAISVPIAVLIDEGTKGAAEALAAVLRATDRGILLGTATAGEASLYKEFVLSNGQKLRVASVQIKLGDGTALNQPVAPDIAVQATLADDRAYLENPYKDLHPPRLAWVRSTTNSDGVVSNQPSRRFNETELIREQKEGGLMDESSATKMADEPSAPILADPALARAVDLLKGLVVVQRSKPG